MKNAILPEKPSLLPHISPMSSIIQDTSTSPDLNKTCHQTSARSPLDLSSVMGKVGSFSHHYQAFIHPTGGFLAGVLNQQQNHLATHPGKINVFFFRPFVVSSNVAVPPN